MVTHVDYFESRDRLRRPFFSSVGIHVGIVLSLVGWEVWLNRDRDRFGDLQAGGGDGSVTVTPVDKIPLRIPPAPVNKVADDTQSEVPTPREKKIQKETVKDDDDPKAISLGRKKNAKKVQQQPRRYHPETDEDLPNQLTTTGGRRLSSDMYAPPGSLGPVGIGENTALGTRFGWYQKILQERIARAWHTGGIDLRTAPRVVVTFEILRNGSVRNLRITQPSGNYALDTSVERAVMEASPFPELPAGFERNSAKVEMNFQYKR